MHGEITYREEARELAITAGPAGDGPNPAGDVRVGGGAEHPPLPRGGGLGVEVRPAADRSCLGAS